MTERLTKRLIDRLAAEADPARDTLVWDQEVPGLVLRLRSGSARFAFQYKHHGRTRRLAIGRFPVSAVLGRPSRLTVSTAQRNGQRR